MSAHDHHPGLISQASTISRLGAPMIGFFLVQNATSLVCLSIVGRLGDGGLAGIGAAGAFYGVIMALLYGIDTGVQAISSRATGAGEGDRLGEILTAAIAGAAVLGALLAGLVWAFGPGIVALMLSDSQAAVAGSRYIAAYAPSLLFLAISIPIDACWIGSGRPGAPFLVYLLLAPAQVGLTWLFVAGGGPVADSKRPDGSS